MTDRTPASASTVVILGGGIGGLAAASRLRRRLNPRHRVILVNQDPDFTLAASYLWVMAGKRRPSQVTRPLLRLKRRGIEIVIGRVEQINPVDRTITVDGREIAGYYLIVALGAAYADTVPGLQEAGLTFATLNGAQQLGQAVQAISRGRILVVTASPLYRCPAAPYEAALLIDAVLRHRGVRGQVGIALHSAEPAPMGVAGPNVSAAVTALLSDRAIEYQSSHQITSCQPGTAEFADGQSESFDMLVYMPPITPPDVVTASQLAGDSGWIHADRHTLATSFPHVYAIGDNTQIPLSIGKPLPRAGVFAHAQAHVVADNIAALIQGRPATATFDGHGGCFIETGYGKAGYGSGDFYAEPSPAIRINTPSWWNHWGKMALEVNVLNRWM